MGNKTDPMAFILTIVGGLMVLASIYITFYIAAMNMGIIELLTAGIIATAALPFFIAGLVLLALARIIDILYNN